MPRGDRTGPDGMGQMTGRGMGYCAGYDSPGFTKGIPRGGAGHGRGFRGGLGYNQRGFYPGQYPTYPQPGNYSNVSEKTLIENEIKVIEEQLQALGTRLAELSKEEK